MPNATFLTEKYPGKKRELWTPCIWDFFRQCNPELPVTICIDTPPTGGPWFTRRKPASSLKIVGEIWKEPNCKEFLPAIGKAFGRDLSKDPMRVAGMGDIAGIQPDILFIHPDPRCVHVIENKPYGNSAFSGNQGRDSAYVHFVTWLNERGIPCEYLLIQSTGWTWPAYQQVKAVQESLRDHFGVLLLEHIFCQMHLCRFSHPRITERWIDYADTGRDYIE